MARLDPEFARDSLLQRGPWVDGSAHGYHEGGEGFSGIPGGKYGHGYQHCLFCKEDVPFHREYCPWKDYLEPDNGEIVTKEEWGNASLD